MKLGKLAIGAVAAFVFFYLTDWLYYGMLMKDSMTPVPGMREAPLMLYMTLGILLYAIGFAYIYTKGAEGGSPAGEGARYGVWVTILMWLPLGLIFYGLYEAVPLQEHLTEVGFRLVQSILGGVLVAYATGIPGSRSPGKGIGGGDG